VHIAPIFVSLAFKTSQKHNAFMELRIKDIISFLESFAPLYLQEDYDNCGLQTGDPTQLVSGVLVTLDVTEEVIGEAIDRDCSLIVAHHPVIFKPLKRLTGATLAERCLLKAIKNNIAIYVIHTNIDNAWQGLNFSLAQKLGLQQVQILRPEKGKLNKLVTFCPLDCAEKVREALFHAGAGHIGNYDSCSFNITGNGTFRALEGADPYVGNLHELHTENEVRIEVMVPAGVMSQVVQAMFQAHPYEEVAYDIYPLNNVNPYSGSGAYGLLDAPLDAKTFLDELKDALGSPGLRYSGPEGHLIQRVGVCGGSGSFLIDQAILYNLDVLVTADIKYHQFWEASEHLLLVDAGHYETEILVTSLISDLIQKKFPNFACRITSCNTNPVKYL
jgi:dinuclear metal center YbgI/SA1388 family protein